MWLCDMDRISRRNMTDMNIKRLITSALYRNILLERALLQPRLHLELSTPPTTRLHLELSTGPLSAQTVMNRVPCRIILLLAVCLTAHASASNDRIVKTSKAKERTFKMANSAVAVSATKTEQHNAQGSGGRGGGRSGGGGGGDLPADPPSNGPPLSEWCGPCGSNIAVCRSGLVCILNLCLDLTTSSNECPPDKPCELSGPRQCLGGRHCSNCDADSVPCARGHSCIRHHCVMQGSHRKSCNKPTAGVCESCHIGGRQCVDRICRKLRRKGGKQRYRCRKIKCVLGFCAVDEKMAERKCRRKMLKGSRCRNRKGSGKGGSRRGGQRRKSLNGESAYAMRNDIMRTEKHDNGDLD